MVQGCQEKGLKCRNQLGREQERWGATKGRQDSANGPCLILSLIEVFQAPTTKSQDPWEKQVSGTPTKLSVRCMEDKAGPGRNWDWRHSKWVFKSPSPHASPQSGDADEPTPWRICEAAGVGWETASVRVQATEGQRDGFLKSCRRGEGMDFVETEKEDEG